MFKEKGWEIHHSSQLRGSVFLLAEQSHWGGEPYVACYSQGPNRLFQAPIWLFLGYSAFSGCSFNLQCRIIRLFVECPNVLLPWIIHEQY